MSYFKKLDGSEVVSSGEYESGGGFEAIPDDTECHAYISEVEWKQPPATASMQDECIGVEWTIATGDFKNRKIFQNLRVKSDDEKIHDKGMLVLATLYSIAGKDVTKIEKEPSDADLNKILLNQKAGLKIGLMKDKKDGTQRNYIKSIKSTKKELDDDGDDIKW